MFKQSLEQAHEISGEQFLVYIYVYMMYKSLTGMALLGLLSADVKEKERTKQQHKNDERVEKTR